MTTPAPYDPLPLIPERFHRDAGHPLPVSDNERRVLGAAWDSRGLTRSALSHRLDLTQQSIHRLIEQLCERGMLRLGALEPPVYKGKPSPRLDLSPDHACTYGISINTDTAGLAVMDFAGGVTTRMLEIDGIPMEPALDTIARTLEEMREEAGFPRDRVFGIGFAISGFLVEGTRYNAPEPLTGWSERQMGPYLAARFGLPVWTENGANTGALCERMLGIGREVEDFAYLSFNYGFGGGIITGGNLLRGGFGNAGELSGMFTPQEAASRPALRYLLDRLQANGIEVRTINELSQRFDMNWPGVADWLDTVAPYHSRVVNVLSATVDPQVIVLGGQIPPALAEALIERTEFWQVPRHGVNRRIPDLRVSAIRGETSAIGAASLPLKNGFF